MDITAQRVGRDARKAYLRYPCTIDNIALRQDGTRTVRIDLDHVLWHVLLLLLDGVNGAVLHVDPKPLLALTTVRWGGAV
jgi:hypothetical protein